MLKRGDIVLLPYPFTDLTGQKPRPALVISSDNFNNNNQDAVFIFITKTDYKTPYDLRIESNDPRFLPTGLKSPSTFRTSKVIT
ncbi:MAG: type II toxin-antitoxin system PemK/MazF family toxin, partial [Nitrospirota bacterium]|nr:type II toxin-antitoxin system PemK/MazF family toxin [Nitrospirota bacterium]